jgi:hypothetical protein
VSISSVWALCDFQEQKTGAPTTSAELNRVLGVERSQLRRYERGGRLDVYYVTDDKGTRQKAYMRPKGRG